MSALALKGNSYYGKTIKDLGLMPSNALELIKEVPEHFKTQEMCIEVVHIEPRSLASVPDKLKAEEICNKAFYKEPYTLDCVPDYFKT